MGKPIIGITMGDAAGIGPEITVKTLSEKRVYEWCSPIVLGDAKVMELALKITGLNFDIRPVKEVTGAGFQYGVIDVLDYANIDIDRLKLGVVDEMCGRAAVIYTQEAGRMALEGKIQAIVSAPLNKDSMHQAGYRFEGQAQILAEVTGIKRYGMLLILGSVRLMLVTTHVSLRKACDMITKDRVVGMIELANESLTSFGIKKPKIAVSALNPHGGEGGLFGTEEIAEIIPAIEEAKKMDIDAIGPIPADTVFVRAKEGEFDIVLALYHDQGTMAMKLLGFGTVVTLLSGLPIIRTSVGHGTAFDIAGKNIADPKNLIEAVRVAAQMARVKFSF